MNRSLVAAGVAAAALAAVVAVEAFSVDAKVDDVITGTEKPYDSKESGVSLEVGSMAMPRDDGGLAWAVTVKVADGGLEARVLLAPDFVRQRPDGGPCSMRLPDGGVINPGPWTRFPADAAVGLGCELVAQVVLGVDGRPDLEDEAQLVRKAAVPKDVKVVVDLPVIP
ncbi:MAG: hypothetical protein QM817_10360 [Archangium sp.]